MFACCSLTQESCFSVRTTAASTPRRWPRSPSTYRTRATACLSRRRSKPAGTARPARTPAPVRLMVSASLCLAEASLADVRGQPLAPGQATPPHAPTDPLLPAAPAAPGRPGARSPIQSSLESARARVPKDHGRNGLSGGSGTPGGTGSSTKAGSSRLNVPGHAADLEHATARVAGGEGLSPGNRGEPGNGTGDGAWTWSWTRSGGCARGSRRTPCRSRPASWAGRR